MIINFSYNGMQSSICIHTRDRYNMTIRIQPFNVTLYSEYQFEVVYVYSHVTHSCTISIVCMCIYICICVYLSSQKMISLFFSKTETWILSYIRVIESTILSYTHIKSLISRVLFFLFLFISRNFCFFPPLCTSL